MDKTFPVDRLCSLDYLCGLPLWITFVDYRWTSRSIVERTVYVSGEVVNFDNLAVFVAREIRLASLPNHSGSE